MWGRTWGKSCRFINSKKSQPLVLAGATETLKHIDAVITEVARRAITRCIKRLGTFWIRVFPDIPVSQKPPEVRMGSAKGSPGFWRFM